MLLGVAITAREVTIVWSAMFFAGWSRIVYSAIEQ